MMAAHLFSRPLLLPLFALLLSSVQASLVGTLSHSPDAPNIVMAVITNMGNGHLSILKHNTIFDTSHPSKPFTLTDTDERPMPIGGVHVFHTGVQRQDFLTLPPGGTFQRELDLDDYVQFRQSTTVSIALSSTFAGLEEHNSTFDAPLDATARTRIALTDIPHNTRPLQIRVDPPPPRRLQRRRILESRNPTTWSGIRVPSRRVSGCSRQQSQTLHTAILHASYLAVAGKNAAANFTEMPFKYFLPANLATATLAGDTFDKIVQAQMGQGPQVQAVCSDHYNLCIGRGRTAYAETLNGLPGQPPPGFIPTVHICPEGFKFPQNPTPCTGTAGDTTIGYLFLHEMLHLHELIGRTLRDIEKPKYRQSARNVHNDLVQGKDTTLDVDAYAWLGSWAWDLGLGDPTLWDFKGSCVTDPLKGNLDSIHRSADGRIFTG